MADPNQTPSRGDWACPCAGCAKAVAFERKEIINLLSAHLLSYQKYRGSSFDENGTLLWMKDEVETYSEAINSAIELIKERMPKPKPKQQ